jgi:VCBS repeat-containing protein
LVRRALPGIVRASGGAHPSTKPNHLRDALDDVVDALRPDETKPAAAEGSATTHTPVGRSNRRQHAVDQSPAPGASTLSTTQNAARSRPDNPTLRRIVVDYADSTDTAKHPAPVTITNLPSGRADVVSQTMSVPHTNPAEPHPTMTTAVMASPGNTGPGPSAVNGPLTPLDSPLQLALLAIGARTRPPGSTANDQNIGTTQTFTTSATAVANAAPVITRLTAGNPNATTGKVTIKVTASDANRNPLTYTATTTGKGTTTFNAVTKTFTYTPTAAARHAAASQTATPADKQDTVTVTVTDGQGGVTSRSVTVVISPKNRVPTAALSVGKPDTTTGVVTGKVTGSDPDNDDLKFTAPTTTSKGGAVTVNATTGAFNYTPTAAARLAASAPRASSAAKTDRFNVTITDGHGGTVTKAVTVSIAPAVTAGNIATVIGNFTVPGYRSGSSVVSPDGSRAVVTTYVPSASGTTTRVSLINTATGRQTGATVALTGIPSGLPAQFSADGSRAVVATSVSTAAGTTTRVSLINTATGAQTGTTVTFDGNPAGVQLVSVDGSNALVTTMITTASGTATRAAVFNTSTGIQTGTTVTVQGIPEGILLNAKGDRALVTAVEQTDRFTTRVVVIDTTTGTQTDKTLEFAGYGTPQFSADGTRALIATTAYDPTTGTDVARISVIDTATGAQIGATHTFAGANVGTRALNADGSRALVTYLDQGAGLTRTAVINTVTGAQIGSGLAIPGGESFSSPAFSADGTHALITTIERNEATGAYTTRAAVIDTATGAQVGTLVTIAGESFNSQLLRADGSRALITTAVYDAGTSTFTTQATVIDTATGTRIGTPVTLTGYLASGPVQVSRDGTRAVIATTGDNRGSQTSTTRVAVIDTTTGAQVGSTVSLAGYGYTVMNADGSRAVVATGTGTGTQVAVIDTRTGIAKTLSYSGPISGTPIMSPDGKRALITIGSNPVRVVVLQIA